MKRSVLEIILKLEGEEARRELKKVDKELDEVEDSAKKSSESFMGVNKELLAMGAVAGGAIVGAVKLGQAIWDMGKSGAAAKQTGESFEFLLEKVGAAPDLLDQLTEATLGTVDAGTLMESTLTLTAGASDELSKKMMEAAPQLAEIAKAANKLNPALGDTAFMYESIGKGVKRAQPLILDNLGLTLKVGESNLAFAESIGKTVEELTAEEKAMAILNATLEAGDTLIDQVGGNVEAAGDSFAQASTEIANLKSELSILVFEGIQPAVSGLAGMLAEVNASRNAYAELKRALDAGVITLDEHNEMQWKIIDGLITTEELTKKLEKATEKYNEEIEDVTSGLEYSKEAQRDMSDAITDGIETTDDFSVSMEEMGLAAAGAKDAIDGLTGALTGEYAAALKASTNSVYELERAKLVMKLATENLSQVEIEHALNMLDSIDRVETLTQAVKDGEVSQRDLRLAIMDGIVTADEYNSMMGETAEAIDYAAIKAWYLVDGLAAASGDWNATFTLDIVQRGGSMADLKKLGITGAAAARAIEEGIGGQHGLDMVVPPGYPHDSFPIWTTSGEHVQVTPGGRNRGGRLASINSKVYNILREGDNVYVQNSAAAAYLVEKQLQTEFDDIDQVI